MIYSQTVFIIQIAKILLQMSPRFMWGNIISTSAYADELTLFDSSEQELQNSLSDLEAASMNLRMAISESKAFWSEQKDYATQTERQFAKRGN